MKLTRKREMDPEINVGAFSDIAFLLIIFFILTTTFIKPTGRELDIPSSTSDPEQKQEQQLTVTLTPNEMLWNDSTNSIDLDQLRERLASENLPAKAEEKRVVVVESGPQVGYERYFQVVMAISNAGGILGMIEKTEGGEAAPAP